VIPRASSGMGSMINIGSCNVSNSGDSGFDNPNLTANYRRNFDSGPH